MDRDKDQVYLIILSCTYEISVKGNEKILVFAKVNAHGTIKHQVPHCGCMQK